MIFSPKDWLRAQLSPYLKAIKAYVDTHSFGADQANALDKRFVAIEKNLAIAQDQVAALTKARTDALIVMAATVQATNEASRRFLKNCGI